MGANAISSARPPYKPLVIERSDMPYCRVPLPRLVCAEYSASKVVVEATLAQIQVVHDKDDREAILAYIYTLHTDRELRG